MSVRDASEPASLLQTLCQSKRGTFVSDHIHSVPVRHDRVTVSQHEQYSDPETEAAEKSLASLI